MEGDVIRYLCWGIWLVSLPLLLLRPFLGAILMATFGGGSPNFRVISVVAGWFIGVPALLYFWGQSK